jgi:hypothetical protein
MEGLRQEAAKLPKVGRLVWSEKEGRMVLVDG